MDAKNIGIESNNVKQETPLQIVNCAKAQKNDCQNLCNVGNFRENSHFSKPMNNHSISGAQAMNTFNSSNITLNEFNEALKMLNISPKPTTTTVGAIGQKISNQQNNSTGFYAKDTQNTPLKSLFLSTPTPQPAAVDVKLPNQSFIDYGHIRPMMSYNNTDIPADLERALIKYVVNKDSHLVNVDRLEYWCDFHNTHESYKSLYGYYTPDMLRSSFLNLVLPRYYKAEDNALEDEIFMLVNIVSNLNQGDGDANVVANVDSKDDKSTKPIIDTVPTCAVNTVAIPKKPTTQSNLLPTAPMQIPKYTIDSTVFLQKRETTLENDMCTLFNMPPDIEPNCQFSERRLYNRKSNFNPAQQTNSTANKSSNTAATTSLPIGDAGTAPKAAVNINTSKVSGQSRKIPNTHQRSPAAITDTDEQAEMLLMQLLRLKKTRDIVKKVIR